MAIMKNKLPFFITLCLCSIVFLKCKKSSNSCHWVQPPPAPIFFQIFKSGHLITDSTFLSSIKLSYEQNGIKYYLAGNYFKLLNGTDSANNISYNNKGVMSVLIGAINNYSKIYYLEYPANFNSQDTLYAYYSAPSSSTNCEYKLNPVAFNGVIASMDTKDFSFYVFKFNKL